MRRCLMIRRGWPGFPVSWTFCTHAACNHELGEVAATHRTTTTVSRGPRVCGVPLVAWYPVPFASSLRATAHPQHHHHWGPPLKLCDGPLLCLRYLAPTCLPRGSVPTLTVTKSTNQQVAPTPTPLRRGLQEWCFEDACRSSVVCRFRTLKSWMC